jgi:hypothetical protein
MAQIAYWVMLDDKPCGALLFALPRLSVPFHGYAPMSLIELARCWLQPAVQDCWVRDQSGRSHNLPVASCALGKSLRVIRRDWHGKYPHLPHIRACVAWSDRQLHRGTIYQAANFVQLGMTSVSQPGAGTRRTGGHHLHHSDYLRVKATYLYAWKRPLSANEFTAAELDWANRRPSRRIRTNAQSLSE